VPLNCGWRPPADRVRRCCFD